TPFDVSRPQRKLLPDPSQLTFGLSVSGQRILVDQLARFALSSDGGTTWVSLAPPPHGGRLPIATDGTDIVSLSGPLTALAYRLVGTGWAQDTSGLGSDTELYPATASDALYAFSKTNLYKHKPGGGWQAIQAPLPAGNARFQAVCVVGGKAYALLASTTLRLYTLDLAAEIPIWTPAGATAAPTMSSRDYLAVGSGRAYFAGHEEFMTLDLAQADAQWQVDTATVDRSLALADGKVYRYRADAHGGSQPSLEALGADGTWASQPTPRWFASERGDGLAASAGKLYAATKLGVVRRDAASPAAAWESVPMNANHTFFPAFGAEGGTLFGVSQAGFPMQLASGATAWSDLALPGAAAGSDTSLSWAGGQLFGFASPPGGGSETMYLRRGGRWETIGTVPAGAASVAAAGLVGEEVFVFAFSNSGAGSFEILKRPIGSGSWTKVGSPQSAFFLGGCVAGTRAYALQRSSSPAIATLDLAAAGGAWQVLPGDPGPITLFNFVTPAADSAYFLTAFSTQGSSGTRVFKVGPGGIAKLGEDLPFLALTNNGWIDDGNYLYVGGRNSDLKPSVKRYPLAGSSWQNVPIALPATSSIAAIAIDKGGNTLYLETDEGLFAIP
ncbi:MAG: hypothetical protein FJZ00_06780, partial [Candidatus Sericytochromatia bacterium]|nr:hypothetical protein [Candidatus Tanganyikabacteria bacterium]